MAGELEIDCRTQCLRVFSEHDTAAVRMAQKIYFIIRQIPKCNDLSGVE